MILMNELVYQCNICGEYFKTKGEALAHHYKTHKKLSLK